MSHRPPRRRAPIAVAAMGAVLVLAACSSGAGPDDRAEGSLKTSDGASADGSQPPDDEPPESLGQPPSESPGQSPRAEESSSPQGQVPPFPYGTARQMGDYTRAGGLVLTDVRAGQHQGFDRVVLEFTGAAAPGWVVNYVEEATLEGSGEVVPLAGETTLDIYASGTTYPGPDATTYDGPRQFAAGGGVAEVHVAGTFEGYTQVLAGIEGAARPFRVFTLTDPPRLVVDVAREG